MAQALLEQDYQADTTNRLHFHNRLRNIQGFEISFLVLIVMFTFWLFQKGLATKQKDLISGFSEIFLRLGGIWQCCEVNGCGSGSDREQERSFVAKLGEVHD